jgi:hypothetical protein
MSYELRCEWNDEYSKNALAIHWFGQIKAHYASVRAFSATWKIRGGLKQAGTGYVSLTLQMRL